MFSTSNVNTIHDVLGGPRVIRKKASTIYIGDKMTVKVYGKKYYKQLMHFNTPGEPRMSVRYPHRWLPVVYGVVVIPKEKLHEVKKSIKLHDKEVHIPEEVLIRESFKICASNIQDIIHRGLLSVLIEWMQEFIEDSDCFPIRHRDIHQNHIMWSDMDETFKLIDLMLAVPKSSSKTFPVTAREEDLRQAKYLVKVLNKVKSTNNTSLWPDCTSYMYCGDSE